MLKESLVLFLTPLLLSNLPAMRSREKNEDAFVKTEDGVIVYPNVSLSGGAKAVRLKVITNNIIRVTSTPTDKFTDKQSLIISYATKPEAKWIMVNNKDKIVLKTASLAATVNIATGAVSFSDSLGNAILSEKQWGGRNFSHVVYDGEASYHISQIFQTSDDDACYGLGQHQDDVYDRKGFQTLLFQNNTEIAVPFLVSNKNYGILWDNYAISSIGDTRPYLPLSALKLFDKKGEPGWLSASYSNDKKDPDHFLVERASSAIDYEYLGDSKLHLPSDFDAAHGRISWNGSIASGMAGLHTFKFTYGGYLKVWIDSRLVLDRWRQAWNPGVGIVQLNLEKDKKYVIKIQWEPDGTESYLSMKWLDPVTPEDKNNLGFVSEAAKQLDYYFVHGRSIDDVISGYRTLTGKATIPPKWAFGFWQSRERYKSQDEILTTVSEFRKRKIPLDNIVLDWNYWKEDMWGSQEFDSARFPDTKSMIKLLHDSLHAHIMISVWPKFYEGIPAYNAFNAKGWLYKRNVANRQVDWKGYVSTFYDVFNKDAQKGFWKLLNEKLYSKGIDAFWMDASEPDILSNVSPEKRQEEMRPTAIGVPAEFLNAYPLENAKGIYQGQRATNNNKRVFTLTRSAFAGSQRYAAAVWSGDIASRWSDMQSQITAGINFSMSGIPYWTMDIGGFAVEKRFEHPSEIDREEWIEQMTRWYQFGAFCPLFRVHGQFPYREMYNTAPENHPAYKSMLFYDKLRYSLMPYIYSLAGMSYYKDYTVMRGLVMDFPNDSLVTGLSHQYLFGPSLLINPVCRYKARNQQLYLPRGQGWYDLYSGKYTDGGQAINADAPFERIPVFVKEGSIIPFGPQLQYTAEKTADTITLYVYTGKDASFSIYEDEDTNYNYEKGDYTNIPIFYDQSSKTLTIGKREGSFKTMLKDRQFNIVWVTKNRAVPWDFNAHPDQVINYDGRKKMIRQP
jgi:alpha-D-xyloside xylohydrolase